MQCVSFVASATIEYCCRTITINFCASSKTQIQEVVKKLDAYKIAERNKKNEEQKHKQIIHS